MKVLMLNGSPKANGNTAMALSEMEKVTPDSLMVFPEYSNAGGTSDMERERAAMPSWL